VIKSSVVVFGEADLDLEILKLSLKESNNEIHFSDLHIGSGYIAGNGAVLGPGLE